MIFFRLASLAYFIIIYKENHREGQESRKISIKPVRDLIAVNKLNSMYRK